jgi:outer membrane protein insertion porin family
VRGGNLLFNPRAELRIPLSGALETVGFLDLGNLWTEVAYPFEKGEFPLRYAVGTGLRVQTPVFPIVFDIGFNPSRRYFERSWAFNFAIGLF